MAAALAPFEWLGDAALPAIQQLAVDGEPLESIFERLWIVPEQRLAIARIVNQIDLSRPPVFAPVARELLDMLTTPASNDDVVRALSTDAGLVVRLLHLARNQDGGRPVDTLGDAGEVLGLPRLRQAALNTVAIDLHHSSDVDRMRLWEHGLGVAVGARLFALEFDVMDPQVAFYTALAHDIGKLLLYHASAARLRVVSHESACWPGATLLAERRYFACDHAQLGAVALALWNLPLRWQLAARFHHQLVDAFDSPFAWDVALVELADHFCHRLGIGLEAADGRIDPSVAEACQLLQIEDFELRISEFEEAINRDFFALRSIFY